MKRIKITLKILTILSYFLPFTFFTFSCDGLIGFKISYNKKEASELKAAEKLLYQSAQETQLSDDTSIVDTTLADTSNIQMKSSKPEITSPERNNKRNFWKDLLSFAFFPTDKSLSAFGVLLYPKDNISFILIAASIFLSIVVLLENLIRFIKRNLIVIYSINLICLLAFIVHSTLSANVDLEWGVIITVIFITTGLFLNIKERYLKT